MPDPAPLPPPAAASHRLRHTAAVRVTHWITALCFLALLISGAQLVISHPRFYWGETGNVNTESVFELPIPSSRAAVKTGYGYVLPDQNGWSRYLHFQVAWVVVFAGLLYLAYGFITRHFGRNLLPAAGDLSWRTVSSAVLRHLRFERPAESEAWSYNVLQRLAYAAVVFLLFPLMIWTGLAMSPAVVSVFPGIVTVLGGHQSARTIHFVDCVLLVLFLLIHVGMVWLAGFRNRMAAMITGRAAGPMERA